MSDATSRWRALVARGWSWLRVATKHPVVSAVVVAGLAALFPAVRALLASAPAHFVYCHGFYAMPVAVPRWLLVVLITMSVVAAVRIWVSLLSRWQGRGVPSHLDGYRTDLVYGVRWRWSYLQEEIHGASLSAHCVECDMELDSRPAAGHLRLRCDNDACGQTHKVLHGEPRETINKVMRHIERRIRTGEWREGDAPPSHDS